MDAAKLRAIQAPLKERYLANPETAVVPCEATGIVELESLTCRVNTHLGTLNAGLHQAAGGVGKSACSGDMLLEALVACAGVTLGAVATSMGIEVQRAVVKASGKMDFRGTLGVNKSVPVGIQQIDLFFEIDSPADDAKLDKLVQLVERYCVILQTLKTPPPVSSRWTRES